MLKSYFKNKHIVVALIVTPILSVVAYFATDYIVSERPHQAQAGGQYQLVQLPNCRYASGLCGLKNGNFKVVITGVSAEDNSLLLELESVFALDEAYVSVVKDPADTDAPVAMEMFSEDGKLWRLTLQVANPLEQYLRLALTADGAAYYGETAMPFLEYKTSFKKDLRPRG